MPEIVNQIITFMLIFTGVWIVWHVVQFFLRTIRFTPAMFQEFITQGHPTLVYFHGRNCELCRHTRKAVLHVMSQMDKDVQLLLINTSSKGGKDIAHEFGVDQIPTCVIFDPQGLRAWAMSGLPDIDELLAQLKRVKSKHS